MASAYYTFAFLAFILVLLPWTLTSNLLSPLLSPIFDDVCKAVECGKGACEPSHNSTFFFVCDCEPGWKQARPDHDDDLRFLPCVIPNCTLDYSCTEAPSPVQQKEKKNNESFFDPCHWADCGGGMCDKTSLFTHRCNCQEGYYNLLNVTAFPCFRDCALGMDCSNLGITVMNKSTSSSTSNLPDNNTNQACSIQRDKFTWLIIVFVSFASILWK